MEIIEEMEKYLFSISNILTDVENKITDKIEKELFLDVRKKLDNEFKIFIINFKDEFENSNNIEKIELIKYAKRYLNVVDVNVKKIIISTYRPD